MVVEYIRYRMTSHSKADLIDAYRAASEHLRAATECLSFEIAECEEDEALVTVRILWSSTHEHLNGFRKGPNFPPFLDAIRDFIPEIEEMRHYAVTDSWTRN